MVSKLMAFFECDGIINNDNNNNNNEQEKLDQNNKSSIIGQIQLSYTNTDNNNNYYYCHCGEYELNVTKNRKLNHLPEVKISAPATLSVATTHTNNTILYVRYLLFVIIASTKNIISNIENNFTTMTTTPYPLWQQKNNKNEDKYERPTIIKTILTTISSPTSSLLSFRPSSNTINSSSHSLSSLQLKKATTKDQMLNNPTGLKNNMTFIVVSDIINLETTMSPFSQMISRSKLLSNENEWNDEQKIHNITTTMSTTLINTNNVTLSKKSENSDNILSNNNTIMTGTEMIKNIIIEQNLKEKSVQIDHNQISKLNNFITKNWNKLNFNEKLLNESEQMIMLSDATHTNSNSTNNNFLQQHNIYRYYSQRQENDLKTLLSRYPSLRLPPPPPEFADDFDPVK
ncbi:hypothetical protein DERP_010448 [Dermatophagoides pteronyssinus]|uniref:Uncharacterized protein n=1 Tax=Dermatophagoides pteronyssinus TaxID=6956 RepID=A0ABQ8J4Y3_DERPT|nr:hypothetical protein DERP_010448 [Dermatophagoides pteronyssinus]